MHLAKLTGSLLALSLIAQPAFADTRLTTKEKARIHRAAPKDRDEVRYCLIQKKKGAKKGTIIGAAGGAGVSLVAGGGVAETALAAGAGALAGRAIGKGTATNSRCDQVLKANP